MAMVMAYRAKHFARTSASPAKEKRGKSTFSARLGGATLESPFAAPVRMNAEWGVRQAHVPWAGKARSLAEIAGGTGAVNRKSYFHGTDRNGGIPPPMQPDRLPALFCTIA